MRRQIKRYVFNMGYHVMILYRVSHFFHFRIPWAGQTMAIAVRHLMRFYSSCDISPKAVISKSCKFPHPLGIVIGDGVIVKDKVKIWHRVTLGSHGRAGESLEYPIIEKNARIFNSATIVGSVILGEGCTIGAHAFVNKNIPAGATAVWIPARIVNSTYGH